MYLHLIARILFKTIAWAIIIICVWWWVGNIMLDVRDGPAFESPPPPRYEVQKDGSVVVLLPPVSVTEAP